MPMDERTLLRGAFTGLAQLALAMALLIFVPAWTLRYWQGWVFLGVFLGASFAITLDLFRHDRALFERRLHVGPTAESRPPQKVIQAVASLAFLATLVVPALDHRLGWSHLPTAVAILGDGLVALGFWIIALVFRENTFAASTVEVSAGQTVTTTGPYAVVRHPMYAGGLVLLVGIPLALGSAWGWWASLAATMAIVWRLLDEEKLLSRDLAGYDAYRGKTRYRLIPYVW
jgi:protein-S-isoprenylcysteine O-methyltransferase Ste14